MENLGPGWSLGSIGHVYSSFPKPRFSCSYVGLGFRIDPRSMMKWAHKLVRRLGFDLGRDFPIDQLGLIAIVSHAFRSPINQTKSID